MSVGSPEIPNDYPEFVNRGMVVGAPVGARGAVRPRVPHQRTRRGVAGYVGDVDYFEPGAPHLAVVDPVREAVSRVGKALITAAVTDRASEIDRWIAGGGDPEVLSRALVYAIDGLLFGIRRPPPMPADDSFDDAHYQAAANALYDVTATARVREAVEPAHRYLIDEEPSNAGEPLEHTMLPSGRVEITEHGLSGVFGSDAGEIIGGREPEPEEADAKEAEQLPNKERRQRRTKAQMEAARGGDPDNR